MMLDGRGTYDVRGVDAGAESLASANSQAQSVPLADRPGNPVAAHDAADGLPLGTLQHRARCRPECGWNFCAA